MESFKPQMSKLVLILGGCVSSDLVEPYTISGLMTFSGESLVNSVKFITVHSLAIEIKYTN